MTNERIDFRVDAQIPLPGRRLLNIVQRLLKCSPQVARREVRQGRVLVNRRTSQDPERILNAGDIVVATPLASKQATRAGDESWSVLFQDDALIVVDKPAGLLTVPSPHGEKRTMISLVSKHLQQTRADGEAFSIHRLDRDVSGLLIFAKSLEIAKEMREQFAARKPERHYTALVAGSPPESQGTIRSFLATDEHLNRYSVETADRGELAITHYRVVEPFVDATQLDVTLDTGRRNQIRIHMAEMGHPVIGETRYRREQAVHRDWPFRRLALHAARIAFTHPVTGARIELESPLPWPFEHFLRQQSRRRQR